MEMNKMTQTNNSATSLPSYHAKQDALPTYSEDLTEPQRAYIAHQRNALENVDAKRSSSGVDNAMPTDVQSQRRQAPSAREIAWDERLNREVDRHMRREKFIRWAGGISLMSCLVLLAVGCIGSSVLSGLVEKGKPSIPPPYPNEETRGRCHRELSPSQTLWFWIAYGVRGGAGILDLVMIYWSISHSMGWAKAAEGTILGLATLTLPAFLLVLTLKGKCAKEFVEGA